MFNSALYMQNEIIIISYYDSGIFVEKPLSDNEINFSACVPVKKRQVNK